MKLFKALFLLLATWSWAIASHAANTAEVAQPSPPVPATPAVFTPEQTQQVEKIIHDYLLNNPKLMLEVVQKLQNQQRQEMEARAVKGVQDNAAAIFNSPQSPVLGNKNGKVHLVEFFDYQCSHCKEASAIIAKLITANPNLRIILKELPIFPNSEYAARAALAAQIQNKFIEMNEALLKANTPLTNEKVLQIATSVGLNTAQLQKDMENKAIKDELAQNAQLAESLGLAGTPSFIIASTKENHPTKIFFTPGMTNQEVLQGFINKAAG